MSEKEKQELLDQINNLTPTEFSKLCLKVVKKIVNRNTTEETVENHTHKHDIRILAKLMIENNIKIKEKEEK